ncbi:MAG: right-handed parallel beta-helix repeat-containing protein [Promethearchaeota archaeon]|jgi:epoxyqueuosine reductase QueG
MNLQEEVKEMLLKQGAVSVGFATKTTLEGGPPSTDLTYVLPEGETIVCFAVPLDKAKIRSYLEKKLPRGHIDHVIDRGDAYLKAYKFSRIASNFLEERGFKSAPVYNNFKYREEDPDWRSKMPPILALRWIAARSGVGSIGWSGNILVKGHGAAVLLGALVTSAKMEPTEPIPSEESLCDKCKLCVKVCAFRMFDNNKEDSFTLGGHTFSFANRNNVLRCYTVCGGHSGLDKTKEWSTWSPGRTPYPETEEDADRAFAYTYSHAIKNFRVKGEEGSFADSKMINDPIARELITSGEVASNTFTKNFITTCGNCHLICWGTHDETLENCKILMNSGCVVTDENGNNIIVSVKKANELETQGKLTSPYAKSSKVLQKYETAVNKVIKRLRNEDN